MLLRSPQVSASPTLAPTARPTRAPTQSPVAVPTAAPTAPTATPTGAPTVGSCGVDAVGAYFRVTNAVPTMTCVGPTSEAQGSCFTVNNGTCITDGDGNYGNNERCTIEVLRPGFLTVNGSFNIEGCSSFSGNCYDYFTINGSSAELITSSSLEGVELTAGTTINWISDNSIIRSGWTLCGSVSLSAFESPPLVSSLDGRRVEPGVH